MQSILVLGAGKVGHLIGELLAATGDYSVTVADQDPRQLARLRGSANLRSVVLDVTDVGALQAELAGKFAVLSACPFFLNAAIAEAAAAASVHYLDLTEDVECTRRVKALAERAETALIPQCGLAPGFITIITYELARHFEQLHDVHMRVGALPKYPSNALKYNLTWSTDGLINEYCNACEAIVEGRLTQVQPLEELETFSLDGVTYEAFNTSGGVGTLCETLAGKVANLNYRSVRYPGHRDIMKLLLQDLRLRDNRPLLKQIFESALPATNQDVVLVFVNVSGIKDGQLLQETYANKIYSQTIHGKLRSAIQVTTAASACAVLDLLAGGVLAQRGFIRQEDVPYARFAENRFGRYFAKPGEEQAGNDAA